MLGYYLYLIENVVNQSGQNTPRLFFIITASYTSMCFPRGCLSITKYSSIYSFKNIIDDVFWNMFVHIFLGTTLIKNSIKSKSCFWIFGTVWKVIRGQLYLSIVDMLNYTGITLLSLVKWPSSNKNFNITGLFKGFHNFVSTIYYILIKCIYFWMQYLQNENRSPFYELLLKYLVIK